MFKIYKFKIGKKYKGFAIRICWFKFEIITFGKKWTIRLELSKGWD